MAQEIVVSSRYRDGLSGGLGRSESRLRSFSRVASAAGRATAVGLGLATVAAVKLGRESVREASQAQQSLGATRSVYGRYANEIVAASRRSAFAVGVSSSEYRELANVTGALLSSSGLPLKQVTGLTQDLTRRASDMAATFGGTTREAIEAVSAALRGETDPIERYGVAIRQTDIDARLAAKGQSELEGKALKLAQAQARVDLIMRQTSRTAGQFKRESNTLANQQQILAAKTDNLQAKLGKALLPTLTSLATTGNKKVLPFLSRAVSDFQSGEGRIGAFGTELRNIVDAASSGEGEFGKIADGASSIADAFADAYPQIKAAAADLPSLGDGLKVAAVGIGFLADNADTLAKYMPAVVAAFVAFKVAQLASNVAVAASPALRLAEVAATRQQTAALRELTAAQLANAPAARTAATASTAAATATRTATTTTSAATAQAQRFGAAQRTAATQTQTAAAATQTATTRMSRFGGAARLAGGAAGLGLLAAGASTSNKALGTLANVGGGALTGFALGGPIGAAVGAGAGLLLTLGQNAEGAGEQVKTSAQKAKEAATSWQDYAASLDQVTAATTASTKQIAFNNLQAGGAIDAANSLGLSQRQLVNGVTGQIGARQRLIRTLNAEQQEINALNRAGANTSARQEALDLIRAETGAVGDAVKAKREEIAATRDYGGMLKGLPRELRTTINQDGIEPSLRNIARLRERYDLTPKQVRTLIKATGFADTEKGARRVQRQLEQVGRARPNLQSYEAATRRSMLRVQQDTRRGTGRVNRELRSTGRGVRANTRPWELSLQRGTGAGQRVVGRGSRAVNQGLGRAGRTTANTRPWEVSLNRGVQAGQRNASRGGRQVADQLSRGPSRAKPNLRNFTGGIDRGVSEGVRKGRTGGSDVARGMTDPVNRARPNMGGYVGGVSSGVGQARGVGSSGGASVGAALKSGIIAGFSGTAAALASQAASAVRSAIAAARREAAIRSPSRKTRRIGEQLGEGLAVGMASKKKRGSAAARKLMRSILSAAGNDVQSLIDRLKAYGKASDRAEKRVRRVATALRKQAKAVVEARNREQRLEAAVKKGSERLKEAIRVRDEYAASIRSSFVEFGNVTSFEEGHLNSTSSFLDQLRDRVTRAQEFAAVVEDLRKRGLNATSLRQILEAGPEAGRAAADAIAAGGKGAIAEVNQLTKDLAATGTDLGKDMGKHFYQAGIDSKRKLLEGLRDRERDAEKRATRLAANLLKAFRKRLDIGGGKGKGKGKRSHAAEALLGTQEAARARGEAYGRALAAGARRGFAQAQAGRVEVPTPRERARAAATTAAPRAGVGNSERTVPVEITARDLDQLVAGRRVKKWIRVADRTDGKS